MRSAYCFSFMLLLLSGMASFAEPHATTQNRSQENSSPNGSRPTAPPNDKKKTKKWDGTEIVWIRDRSIPKLGEAWRDPSGMIWGDIVQNEDGSPRLMSYKEAADYCKSIGAKLPRYEDFIRLRDYMGAKPKGKVTPEKGHEGYEPQVLPNLSEGEPIDAKPYYWSSEFKSEGVSHVFAGSAGAFLLVGHKSELGVATRCVVSTR